MFLIIATCILAVIGVVRLAKNLEPRQRVVLVAVVLLGIAYLVVKLMQFGLLGHQTAQ
jgi:heme/copper-type cytochrome/quinol oxidase subunit 3